MPTPAAPPHAPAPLIRPATARVFARAVEEGQALAATNRAAVEKVLPACMHISANIAALVNLHTFPVSAAPARLQRAASLMAGGGLLARPVSVAALVAR